MAQHAATDDAAGLGGKLNTVAFALAAGIVLARCMTNEIIREPFDISPGADALPRGAGAITAVLLNLLSFIPPLLVLTRAWMDAEARLIRSWSHVTFAALALWAMASTAWSSDTFLTAITSGSLLAAAMLGWTMAQTVHSWSRLRILAGLTVGLLVVLIAHSLAYHYIDAPAMAEMWATNSQTLLKQQGMEPGSFAATLFEKKVLASEIMGFYHSPNTLASVCVLGVLLLLGSMIQRRKLRDAAGWLVPATLILALSAWVISATESRAALATPVVGLGIIIATGMMAGLAGGYRRLTYCTGVLIVCLAIAAVVAHGLAHGGLIERSLTFRWHYWTASLRIFRDHWLAGTGYDNFGLFYPAAKLPFAPEDVKDPHNILARFFTELGVVGGLLAVLWLLQSWWELTRPIRAYTASAGSTIAPAVGPRVNRQATDEPTSRNLGKIRSGGEVQREPLRVLSPVLWPAGLATLIAIIANVDLSQPLILSTIDLMRRGLYGCLLLGGGILVGLNSLHRPHLDDRPGPWLVRGILAALAMFLLHNAIDFSFFEPGIMTLFLALGGAVIGIRSACSLPRDFAADSDGLPPGDRCAAAAPLACPAARWAIIPLLLAGATYGIAIVLPVIVAESAAIAGDEMLRQGDFMAAAADYRAAASAIAHLPNSDYPTREARALYFGHASASAQLDALGRAIGMGPHRSQNWASRAQFRAVLPSPDLGGVLDDFEHAVALDPNNVDLRLTYAAAMERLGQRDHARRQYEEALQRNDSLPPDEIRRLSPARLGEIKANLDRLRAGQS